jgi:hypothetical protein
MSNAFKTNSRFSSLAADKHSNNEDKKGKDNYKKNDKENINDKGTDKRNEKGNEKKTFNSFTSERPIRNDSRSKPLSEYHRNQYILQRENEERIKKEFQQKEKARLETEALQIENFPTLYTEDKDKGTDKDISLNTKISYIEKVKEEIVKDENVKKDATDNDLEIIPSGWVLLKRDPLTKHTIRKTSNKVEDTVEDKVEDDVSLHVLDALVELYEKRTNDYITHYGEDEWEKMFKFPNWVEREAYLEEMEEIANKYEDTDDSSDDEQPNDIIIKSTYM